MLNSVLSAALLLLSIQNAIATPPGGHRGIKYPSYGRAGSSAAASQPRFTTPQRPSMVEAMGEQVSAQEAQNFQFSSPRRAVAKTAARILFTSEGGEGPKGWLRYDDGLYGIIDDMSLGSVFEVPEDENADELNIRNHDSINPYLGLLAQVNATEFQSQSGENIFTLTNVRRSKRGGGPVLHGTGATAKLSESAVWSYNVKFGSLYAQWSDNKPYDPVTFMPKPDYEPHIAVTPVYFPGAGAYIGMAVDPEHAQVAFYRRTGRNATIGALTVVPTKLQDEVEIVSDDEDEEEYEF